MMKLLIGVLLGVALHLRTTGAVLSATPSPEVSASAARALSITVDGNIMEICIDGLAVPETSMPNKNVVSVADKIPLPDGSSVVAVKVNNGNSKQVGFVASDSTGQLVTNKSWRCHVNANPDKGWCGKVFDDSTWNNAVELELYSNRVLAGKGTFSSSAYWIWTSADPSNNGVIYCRGYLPGAGSPGGTDSSSPTSGGKSNGPIVKDTSSITITNIDGPEDIPDLPRELVITGDGNIEEICLNGISQDDLPNHSDVTKADRLPIPSTGGVIAVKVNNVKSTHLGFVVSDTTGRFVTNGKLWRCIGSDVAPTGWCDVDFDDSQWQSADKVEVYGEGATGHIAGYVFSPSAHWIWTSATPTSGTIYCRAEIPDSESDDDSEAPVIVDASGISAECAGSTDPINAVTITKIVGESVAIYAIANTATSQGHWINDGKVASSRRVLRISAVAESDAGVYSTTFRNSAGTTTFTATLVVIVPPVLSGPSTGEYKLNIGDPIEFTNVQVKAGTPTPTVVWYKDGSPISNPPSTASLGDEGTYVVIAENSAGTSVHFAVLKINPPAIEIGPSSPAQVTRHAGTATTIFCSVHGGDTCDRPEVSWTKDGDEFSGNDGSLVMFESVSDSDAGTYTCTYSYSGCQGQAISVSQSIKLSVVDPAAIAESTTEDLFARGGSDVCFKCPLASGTAPVTQRWYVDGQRQTCGPQPDAAPQCLSTVDYRTVGMSVVCRQNNEFGDDVNLGRVTVPATQYLVTGDEFRHIPVTKPFVFHLKASGPVRIALSSLAKSFSNNKLYLVTVGTTDNTKTTVGKKVRGSDSKLQSFDTPGVLSSSEYRWYWISSPAAGRVQFGTGSAIGTNVLVDYTDATSNPLSVSYVGLAAESGAAAMIIYP